VIPEQLYSCLSHWTTVYKPKFIIDPVTQLGIDWSVVTRKSSGYIMTRNIPVPSNVTTRHDHVVTAAAVPLSGGAIKFACGGCSEPNLVTIEIGTFYVVTAGAIGMGNRVGFFRPDAGFPFLTHPRLHTDTHQCHRPRDQLHWQEEIL
jgi:hypothetical protein